MLHRFHANLQKPKIDQDFRLDNRGRVQTFPKNPTENEQNYIIGISCFRVDFQEPHLYNTSKQAQDVKDGARICYIAKNLPEELGVYIDNTSYSLRFGFGTTETSQIVSHGLLYLTDDTEVKKRTRNYYHKLIKETFDTECNQALEWNHDITTEFDTPGSDNNSESEGSVEPTDNNDRSGRRLVNRSEESNALSSSMLNIYTHMSILHDKETENMNHLVVYNIIHTYIGKNKLTFDQLLEKKWMCWFLFWKLQPLVDENPLVENILQKFERHFGWNRLYYENKVNK